MRTIKVVTHTQKNSNKKKFKHWTANRNMCTHMFMDTHTHTHTHTRHWPKATNRKQRWRWTCKKFRRRRRRRRRGGGGEEDEKAERRRRRRRRRRSKRRRRKRFVRRWNGRDLMKQKKPCKTCAVWSVFLRRGQATFFFLLFWMDETVRNLCRTNCY